jgi:hypothetical protein
MHSCPIMVLSMSASSIRLRRPAAGCTARSTPSACRIRPDLPAVAGHAPQVEFGRDAGVQPARLAPAPGVAQRLDNGAVQSDWGGGIGQKRGDEHGRIPGMVSDGGRADCGQRRSSAIFHLVKARMRRRRGGGTPFPNEGAIIWKDTMTMTLHNRQRGRQIRVFLLAPAPKSPHSR